MATLTFDEAQPSAFATISFKTSKPGLQNPSHNRIAEDRSAFGISYSTDRVNVGLSSSSADTLTAAGCATNPPELQPTAPLSLGTSTNPIILGGDSQEESQDLFETSTLERNSDLDEVAQYPVSRLELESSEDIGENITNSSDSTVPLAINEASPNTQDVQNSPSSIEVEGASKPSKPTNTGPESSSKPVSHNHLSCRERKKIFVDPSRPVKLTRDMQQWFHKTNWLLDPFREDDDC